MKIINSSQISLVILGNHTQGLGIVRSARNSRIPIYVVNDLIFSSSRYSKYISSYFKIPKNTIRNLAKSDKNEELVRTLLKLPVKYPSLIMGINEDIVRFIDTNREELSVKYFIHQNPYNIIFDKYEFNNILKEENRIPTCILTDFNINQKNLNDYILKSRTGNKLKNLTGEKALLLSEVKESFKEKIFSTFTNDELIVQKVIRSSHPVKSSCAFSIDGEIFSLFQYEKIRQHPNQFGTGTYLRSIFDNEIFEIAKDLLKSLNYTGISEVEFVLDDSDKVYKIIEMNPRTWKSIHFSSVCEQNMVDKYIKFVQGKKLIPSLNYNTDFFWVDLFTDIPQMLREKKLFKYNNQNLFECTWDKSDPLPFLNTIFLSPFILFKI